MGTLGTDMVFDLLLFHDFATFDIRAFHLEGLDISFAYKDVACVIIGNK